MPRYLTDDEEAMYRRSDRLITPSRPQPWEGSYQLEHRYSDQQLRELDRLKISVDGIEELIVEAWGDGRRIYLPPRSVADQGFFKRRIPCPVIGKHGARKRIITPNGHPKLVTP